jgi:predicted phosphoribosyltransferase
MQRFKNRQEAGEALTKQLTAYQNQSDTYILALPRGGVPVAFEVAKVLHLPLDVYIVRKLGVPGHEELAAGAIASDGTLVLNTDIVDSLGLSTEEVNAVIKIEREELDRRNKLYRKEAPFPDLTGKVIILIDDGLATGATMRAAITAIKKSKPTKIIVAVPVGMPDVCKILENEVDQVICLLTPEPFYGVGTGYEDFSQTEDEEVIHLLQLAKLGNIT